MLKLNNLFIAGHNGMVGKATLELLTKELKCNIITRDRTDLDLTNQEQVKSFFQTNYIDALIICAAKVGGIKANNTKRGEFLYDNTMIAFNLIEAARRHSVNKVIFLGSSCIYPKEAEQPIKEESLLKSELEYTNEPYAIAKIAGLKLCESYYKQYGCNFYSLMPCNLYGENDNFDPESSHVLPGLINKFHKAKEQNSKSITLWGSGIAKREFLHVDDLAKGILFCLNNIDAKDIYPEGVSHLNLGSDEEVSIKELAQLIKECTGFKGRILFDKTNPDGTLRKKMDNTRTKNLGIKQDVLLKEGIKKTYEWYLKNYIDI